MLDDELVVASESAFGVVLRDGKIFWDSRVCEISSSVHFRVWTSMMVGKLVLDKSS